MAATGATLWQLEVAACDLVLPGEGALRWRGLPPGVGGAARWLSDQGLAGRRLGICRANDPRLVALLLAAPLLGSELVLVQHRLPSEQAAEQLSAARCVAVIATEALAGLPLLELPPSFADEDLPPLPSALRGGLLLFTSGSSGRPKAARLSWPALLRRAAIGARHLDLRPGERWLCALGLDHIGGAMAVYRAAAAGLGLSLSSGFDPELIAAALPQVEGASLVPTMLRRVLGLLPPGATRLRCLLCGGAALDDDLRAQTLARGLPLCHSYGLTESCAMACAQVPGRDDGSSGRPLPGIGLRIDAPDDEGIGSIVLSGPTLFDGYEDDAGRLQPRPEWWPTGDCGRLRADGSLEVHSRRSDLIVSGGEKVWPAQIEAILRRHPEVQDAHVLGLDEPHWGQVVAAALVGPGIGPGPFALWCQRHLAPHQRPRRWCWLPALPLTARGKVDRTAIRKMLAQQ